MWRTILRGPRSPAAQWSNQQYHPETSEEAGCEGNEAARFGVRAIQGPSSSGRSPGRSPELGCEAQDSVGHVGRGRRDMCNNQGSSPEGRGLSAGTSHLRADQEHSIVPWSEAKASRRGSPGRHEGSKALAVQEEQEALLPEGEKRLAALQEKEKAMPPPIHSRRTCDGSTRSGRVQPVARDHRWFAEGVGEFSWRANSTFKSGGCPTASDDDEDECRRKKPRAGPSTPLAVTGRGAPTTHAITGGHAQSTMIGSRC